MAAVAVHREHAGHLVALKGVDGMATVELVRRLGGRARLVLVEPFPSGGLGLVGIVLDRVKIWS